MVNGWLTDFIYDSLGQKMKMTSQQKDYILDGIKKYRFTSFLTSRQIGFSCLLKNYIAFNLINNDNYIFGLVSNKLITSRKFMIDLINIIKIINSDLIKTNNLNELILKNNNKFISLSSNVDSIRGYDFNEVLFDTFFSFDFFNNIIPRLISNKNSRLIIGSSLINEEYANFIINYKKNYKEFVYYKLHYNGCSLYNEEKINSLRKSLGDRFKYEYDLDVKGFLELCERNKQKDKKRILQFRVSDNLEYKILERLIELDISFSEYIRNLIKKDLNK